MRNPLKNMPKPYSSFRPTAIRQAKAAIRRLPGSADISKYGYIEKRRLNVDLYLPHSLFCNDDKVPYILYFKDFESMKQLKPTIQKPGRFLKRFTDLSEEEIEIAVRKIYGAYESSGVEFIHDTSEIVKVYASEAVESCMSYPADYFRSLNGKHPCEVYGGDSDLSLAVLKDNDKTVIARSIVWQKKKQFVRVYPDGEASGEKLKNKLFAIGFDFGSLEGARLNLVPVDGENDKICAPYLDGEQRVKVCNGYLKISRNGTIGFDDESGYQYLETKRYL